MFIMTKDGWKRLQVPSHRITLIYTTQLNPWDQRYDRNDYYDADGNPIPQKGVLCPTDDKRANATKDVVNWRPHYSVNTPLVLSSSTAAYMTKLEGEIQAMQADRLYRSDIIAERGDYRYHLHRKHKL